MRRWDKKTIQPANKNCIDSCEIVVKNVLCLGVSDRYELIEDGFLNSLDEIICTCAEEEYFLHQEGCLILDEIPADANLDEDMWWF